VLDGADYNPAMVAAQSLLRERFGITHATLQVEPPDYNIIADVGGEAGVAPKPACPDHSSGK